MIIKSDDYGNRCPSHDCFNNPNYVRGLYWFYNGL